MITSTDFASSKADFEDHRAAVWQRIHDRHQEAIKTKNAKFVLPTIELSITSVIRIANRSSSHSMTLRDLSRATDISMGALYSYIQSKEHLQEIILGEVTHLVETVLDDRSSNQLELGPRLRWLLRRHIHLCEIMQPWFFFAYMEAKSFDRPGRRIAIRSELRTEGLLSACLKAGQATGAFRPVDPVMTASMIKPLLQDWYLKRWKYRRREVTPDSYADWVVEFVEAFVVAGGKPAGEPRVPFGTRRQTTSD